MMLAGMLFLHLATLLTRLPVAVVVDADASDVVVAAAAAAVASDVDVAAVASDVDAVAAASAKAARWEQLVIQ